MIKEARSSKSYALFKKHVTDVPSWNALIDVLNRSYNFRGNPKKNEKIISNKIFMRNPLDLLIMYPFSYSDSPINATNDSINFPLNDLMGRFWSNTTMSLNFVKDEFDKDVSIYHYDTVVWICQGDYDISIYGDKEDALPIEVINLEPGDLIFIPNGFLHKITAKSSAAYIRYLYL